MFYDLLLSALEDMANLVKGKSSSSATLPDNACMDWISPAVLILDAMAQPLLVDRSSIKTALGELEKINKIKESFLPTSSSADHTVTGSMKFIIPPELIASLHARFPTELGDTSVSGSGASSSTSSTSFSTSVMNDMDAFREFIMSVGRSDQSDGDDRNDDALRETPQMPESMDIDDTSSFLPVVAPRVSIASEATTSTGDNHGDGAVQGDHDGGGDAKEEEGKVDTEQATGPLANMFASPLVVENGLTTAMSLRALCLSLDLLEALPSTSSIRVGSMSRALMQLVVHVTRVEEVRFS